MDAEQAIEAALLRQELSALEAQIAALSSPRLARATTTSDAPIDPGTVWDLLDANDRDLERFLAEGRDGEEEERHLKERDRKRRKVEEPGEDPAQALARLEKLISTNAAFTGLDLLPTSHSRLLSAPSPTTFLRRHVLKGTYAPGISVECDFDVLETVPDRTEEAGEEKGERKRTEADYRVVRMDARAFGSGVVRSEVDAWVKHCCRTTSPPTLFRSIRLYALLTTERARTFSGVASAFPQHVKAGGPGEAAPTDWRDRLGETSMMLVTDRGSPGLQLNFTLAFEPPGVVRPSVSVLPRLNLASRPSSSSVSPDGRRLIGEIPSRFQALLAGGKSVIDALGLLVNVALLRASDDEARRPREST